MTTRKHIDPLSEPWRGTPEQRQAWFEKKDRERRQYMADLIALKRSREQRLTPKIQSELKRQAERQREREAQQRATSALQSAANRDKAIGRESAHVTDDPHRASPRTTGLVHSP